MNDCPGIEDLIKYEIQYAQTIFGPAMTEKQFADYLDKAEGRINEIYCKHWCEKVCTEYTGLKIKDLLGGGDD